MKFSEYLDLLGQAKVKPPLDVSAYFFQLRTDRRRYRFCMAMMEYYRTSFWRGQQQAKERLSMLASPALRAQYGQYNFDERQRIANILWFQSGIAKDLVANEQMYCRWAQTYATAAKMGER